MPDEPLCRIAVLIFLGSLAWVVFGGLSVEEIGYAVGYAIMAACGRWLRLFVGVSSGADTEGRA